ncbi:hypothetical protein [Paenibacillus kribbensis]|uniref:hypothetical protein n=1 Tax=Paenibacillus kribbensis TaxID=172713 RepID=UPI002449417B|nr:hypothetical protein [Paenibacillus kribbensis]
MNEVMRLLKAVENPKHRQTLLSEAAFAVVEQYIGAEQPEDWLFPGQREGRHLTERSA